MSTLKSLEFSPTARETVAEIRRKIGRFLVFVVHCVLAALTVAEVNVIPGARVQKEAQSLQGQQGCLWQPLSTEALRV